MRNKVNCVKYYGTDGVTTNICLSNINSLCLASCQIDSSDSVKHRQFTWQNQNEKNEASVF